MDDTEDDARYPPNLYSSNYNQNHVSSHRPKLPVRNASYNQPIDDGYGEEEDDDDEEEEIGEEEQEDEEELGEEVEDEEEDGGQEVMEGKDEEDDDDEDEEEEEEEDGDGEEREDVVRFYRREEEDEESERHTKKRKLKNLGFGYEFAPRVATPSAAATIAAPPPKPSFGGGGACSGGRHSPADWSEHSTFVLLEAWGDKFLQLGRKSLRSDEWHEVAKKVSQVSKQVRTDTQCRNRLDTLKKKYKKEKMILAETSETSSKWVYFKKMDMLLTSSPTSRQVGLSCGLDSGEYVFMNPKSYLNSCNGLDEMRDSPGNSVSSEGNEDDSDGLPPKRTRSVETENGKSSFRLLADSIQKFGQIYEKIENSKRQQMVELEKMRMDFQRDLELQKRQIMERAHAEIVKLRQDDDEDIDVSTENTSG